MLRATFNLAALFSLLLLIITVVLWIRSYEVSDEFSHGNNWSITEFISSEGQMALARFTSMSDPEGFPATPVEWKWEWWQRNTVRQSRPFEVDYREPDFAWAGIEYHAGVEGFSYRTPNRYWAIVVPHWVVAVLTCVLPAWWLLATRGRRVRLRRAAGQCVKCGYDLRGSAEGAACPECGAARA